MAGTCSSYGHRTYPTSSNEVDAERTEKKGRQECLGSTPWKKTSVQSDYAGTKRQCKILIVIRGEAVLPCTEGTKSQEIEIKYN